MESDKETIEKELRNAKRQAQQMQTMERDYKAVQEKLRLLQRTHSGTSSGKVDESAMNELLEEKTKIEQAREKLAAELAKLQETCEDLKREKEAAKKDVEDELKQLKQSIEKEKHQRELVEKAKNDVEDELTKFKVFHKEQMEKKIDTNADQSVVVELQSLLDAEVSTYGSQC